MKIERVTETTEYIIVRTSIPADVFDDTDVITYNGCTGLLLDNLEELTEVDGKVAVFERDENDEFLIFKVHADAILDPIDPNKFKKIFNKTAQSIETLEEAFAVEAKEYEVPKAEGK